MFHRVSNYCKRAEWFIAASSTVLSPGVVYPSMVHREQPHWFVRRFLQRLAGWDRGGSEKPNGSPLPASYLQ
jgi:hypothetical protein